MGFIGMTANGKMVIDRPKSRWHREVSWELLQEALKKITPEKDFEKILVEFPEQIGRSWCVQVDPKKDRIVNVIRKGLAGPTPMVIGKEAEPCNTMQIILLKSNKKDNLYILISAFIGGWSEPEPWDKNKTEKSEEFWSNHALVYDPLQVKKIVYAKKPRE